MFNPPKPTPNPTIWEFNYKPERYIDTTWLETIPNGKLLEKLRQNKRDTSQLSHYLLSQLGFNGQFFFDFSDPIARVALSPPENLKKLVEYIGVTYQQHDIRRTITKAEVAIMKDNIGENVYQFGLQSSPEITKKPLTYFAFKDEVTLKQRILITGIICLNNSFKYQPTALRKRLLIKLPKPWVDLSTNYMTINQIKQPPKNESIYLTHKVAEIANLIPAIEKNSTHHKNQTIDKSS